VFPSLSRFRWSRRSGRARELCKNHSASGQEVWVDARHWGRDASDQRTSAASASSSSRWPGVAPRGSAPAPAAEVPRTPSDGCPRHSPGTLCRIHDSTSSLHAKAKGTQRERIAWGYVFKGKLVYHTADGDIEITDGEAYTWVLATAPEIDREPRAWSSVPQRTSRPRWMSWGRTWRRWARRCWEGASRGLEAPPFGVSPRRFESGIGQALLLRCQMWVVHRRSAVPASSLNWSSYFSIASCIWSWLSHSEIVETRLGSFSRLRRRRRSVRPSPPSSERTSPMWSRIGRRPTPSRCTEPSPTWNLSSLRPCSRAFRRVRRRRSTIRHDDAQPAARAKGLPPPRSRGPSRSRP
jgi:hypothetical protein